MGAADYAGDGWGGALLMCESVVQMTASFDDEAGGASDDVAFGAAQSGVAAAGEAGDSVDGTQPAGAAARAGPAQPNHLKRNATTEYLIIDSTIVRAHPDAAGAPKKGAARTPRR